MWRLIAAVNDSVGADLPVRREQTHVEPRQKLRVYYQVSKYASINLSGDSSSAFEPCCTHNRALISDPSPLYWLSKGQDISCDSLHLSPVDSVVSYHHKSAEVYNSCLDILLFVFGLLCGHGLLYPSPCFVVPV